MSLFSIDVEADGPSPMDYSMVCFGIVLIDPYGEFEHTFYGETAPISDKWIPEALAVSGFSRKEHEDFMPPEVAMGDALAWVNRINKIHGKGRPMAIMDNPAFDWQWINGYFHRYTGENPFGHSASRLADKYEGALGAYYNWKRKHRRTKHDHNPINDAIGNAEATLWFHRNIEKVKGLK